MLSATQEKANVEVLRLIEQYLYENNYGSIAAQLESCSGVPYESPMVSSLKRDIHECNFEATLESLKAFHFADHIFSQMCFAVSVLKYFVAVKDKDTAKALNTLREDVSSFPQGISYAPQLTKLLMFDSENDIDEAIKALPAVFPKSSHELLDIIMRLCPENFIIPNSRLEGLLEQARKYQITQCTFHASSNHSLFSFFRDHRCLSDSLNLYQVGSNIGVHGDEIWHIAQSGSLLASSSKDKTGAVWRISSVSGSICLEPVYRLEAARKPVAFSALSPSSKLCFFSCQDGKTFLLNCESREVIGSLDHLHSLNIVSAVFADDENILTTSEDQTIVLYNISERMPKFRWTEVNCRYLCILQGEMIIAFCAPKMLIGIHLQERRELFRVSLDEEITSMSCDGERFVLLSTLKSSILLFDVQSKRVVRRFEGHLNERYHVQCCFVGHNMIASGSENGSVVIWHRESGSKIITHALQEGMSINAIAYSPQAEVLFVGGDDGRIRMLKFN